MNLNTKEILILLITAALVLAVSLIVIIKEESPDWKYYQSEFRYIVEENYGNVDAASIPVGIQQIWVEGLDRVDRCTTCHLGMQWDKLSNVESPWNSHPNPELFEDHPIEKFGCTTCHGGQGYATTEYEAHGFIKHWEEPLLSEIIGSEYDPADPPPLYEITCNQCHRYERETPGMEYINLAKKIVRDKGCKVCHIINGDGGKLGADLTYEGDKHSEGFDFSNFTSDRLTVFNWHFNHFKSPQSVVPNTIMPDMNLRSKESLALTMLVMSWKDDSELPMAYFPGIEIKEEKTPEEIERDLRMLEGDGKFFAEFSCFICHSVTAFDIKSPTEKGPDLSYAPEDVRVRFNKTVEEFLFEPTGTMEIILGSQIILTDEEKWEAVNKITKAYDIIKNRRDQNQ